MADLNKLSKNLVDSAVASRTADIAAAKTEVLTKVEQEIVPNMFEGAGIDWTQIAVTDDVTNAVTDAKTELNAAIALKADKTYVDSELSDLKTAITDGAGLLDTIKEHITHDVIEEQIHAIVNREAEEGQVYLKNTIDEKFTATNNNVSANATAISNLTTTVADNATTAAAATKKVADDLSSFQDTVSTDYATKKYADDAVAASAADINSELTKVKADVATKAAQTALDAAVADITALKTDKADKTAFDAYKTSNDEAVASAQAAADNAQGDLDSFKTEVSTTYETKATVTNKINTLESSLRDSINGIEENYATNADLADAVSDITALKTNKLDVSAFNTFKAENDNTIAAVKATADAAAVKTVVDAQLKSLSDKIDQEVADREAATDGIDISIDLLKDDLNDQIADVKKTADAAAVKTVVDASITSINSTITANAKTAADATKQVADDLQALNDKLYLEGDLLTPDAADSKYVKKTDYNVAMQNVYTKAEVKDIVNTAIANVLATVNALIKGEEPPEPVDLDGPADDEF